MKKILTLFFILTTVLSGCDQAPREEKRYPDEDRVSNAKMTMEALRLAKEGKVKIPEAKSLQVPQQAGEQSQRKKVENLGIKGFAPLPTPPALLAEQKSGERIKPKFGVETCATGSGEKFQVPFFRAGNKEIYVRRNGNSVSDRTESGANDIIIFVGGKKYISIKFWGANKNGFGYPFKGLKDKPYSVSVDEKNGVYTYIQPYLTESGKTAEAKISMRGLEDGTVEISWDTGDPTDGVNPWIIFSDHRGKKISFGKTEVLQSSKASLASNGNAISTRYVGGAIEFGAGAPVNTVKIIFDDDTVSGHMTESVAKSSRGDAYGLIWRMGKYPQGSTPQRGKFRVDLGECSVSKGTPPPVGNIDFWAYDATHVPRSPVKNLLPNPSFEQGMRYWRVRPQGRWAPGRGNSLEISDDAKFGKKSLKINEGESFYSFPIALDPNKKYILSFYAKNGLPGRRNINVNIQNAGNGGNYPGKWGFGDFQSKESRFSIDGEWKRYQRPVIGDAAGIQIVLQSNSDGPVLIDAMQLEEDTAGAPSQFTTPPIEGNFTTAAYPGNDIPFGQPIKAGLEIFGKPGTTGKVKVSAKNIYYETLFDRIFDVSIGSDGVQKIALPFDAKKFGEGIFSVRADYSVAGFPAYTDYFRFDVMRKLENKHATKNIFGTGMFTGAHSNSDAAGRKFMEWGFGSTTWFRPVFGLDYKQRLEKMLPTVELYKKYRISNQLVAMERALTADLEKFGPYRKWREITPQMEKLIEQNAYIMVKNTPDDVLETFAFGNEEESVTAGRYDDYAKAQLAAYRGAKRAKPHVLVAPTHGTSGYSSSRGRDAIDGYLEAALKRGVRYDAVGVHPYGNYDYDPLWDFDENVTYLKSRLKHYGYPDNTPLYMSECGNMCDANIPPWGTSNYDRYKAGKATYDFGNQEIFQALIYARMYISALKFHPQLRGCNVWTYIPFIDYNFSPLLLCKTVNTLGNLYPDVEFVSDIRPSANVRGYAFKLKDASGIAAVWTTDINVVRGRKTGPIMRVDFGQPVRFFDINGNERSATFNNKGICEIPLTAAPLTIKAADPAKLAEALRNGEVEDTASDIQVTFKPTLDGRVKAEARNTTGRPLKGNLSVGGENFPYVLNPKQTLPIYMKTPPKVSKGLSEWSARYEVRPERGTPAEGAWSMRYFYVPKVEGEPDWSKIESYPIDNWAGSEKSRKDSSKRVKASFQLAWDSNNLYLRVLVKDDKFSTFPENWNDPNANKMLWRHDGAMNVYFDTATDARSKALLQNSGSGNSAFSGEGSYDTNDYVYHFAPSKDGKDGKGSVWRWIEVDHQLADGVNMASKQEASEKIPCVFKKTADGYEYTVTFGKRYIEPIILKHGTAAGFGICLHLLEKREDGKTSHNGISNSTEPGVHTDSNPQFWPIMILK